MLMRECARPALCAQCGTFFLLVDDIAGRARAGFQQVWWYQPAIPPFCCSEADYSTEVTRRGVKAISIGQCSTLQRIVGTAMDVGVRAS
jgi:hypothetical protein